MRYFLHLGYDGKNYSGWQRQKNTSNTIQEVLEQTLFNILKKNVTVYGCGRTDAGVHASQYIAHIDLVRPPEFDLKFRLNKNLPDDIAIFQILEMEEYHHCRYDALSRTYDYFIHWKKDPALIRYSTFYDGEDLDFSLLQKAADLIRKTKDCKALCKHPDLYDNTFCNITESKIITNEAEGRMRFTITSNRFLRGMVRYCVFFLLKVGTKSMSLEEFEKILTQEIQLNQKQPALPNGLFLSQITYPYITFQNENQWIKMLKLGLE